MPKKKPKEGKPEVHKDLDGFEIHINEFGQIIPNKPIDEINEFLNKKVADKKLVDREDYEDIRGAEEADDDSAEKDEQD